MSDNAPDSQDPIESELVKEDASFADIVLQFVEGLNARLTDMEHAIRASDFEALQRAAHQLKGSGGGYGYPVLTERAATLEHYAKSQELFDCQRMVDDLKEICKRLVVESEG